MDQLSKQIDELYLRNIDNKKTNGEVSTPYQLRQDMLDKIPEDFWKYDRKVLEPCCGKGGFLIDIINLFDKHLKHKYKNKKQRYKKIVEKFLFFADINAENVEICRNLIDPNKEYKLNAFVCNSLDYDFGTKFDAVITNPPYNAPNNINTGNTIWQHFVKKSLNDFITDNGYLSLVHPAGWRKPAYEKSKTYGLYDLMVKKNWMMYLSMHTIKEGKKTFNCGLKYDWYVIKKAPPEDTIIRDYLGEISTLNLTDTVFLPNYNIEYALSIFNTSDVPKLKVIYNRSAYKSDNLNKFDPRGRFISEIETDEYKYPVIHTIPRTGIRYLYSNTKDRGYYGIAKIIVGDNGLNDVVVDYEGLYSCTPHSYGIEIQSPEEGELLKKAMLTPEFKQLIKSCIFGNFKIDWLLFTYLDRDFWRHFV